MIDKLALIRPEIALFITTCVVMIVGLSKHPGERRLSAWISAIGIAVAFFLALTSPVPARAGGLMPAMIPLMKAAIALVGLILLLGLTGTADRDYESRVARGARFDPIHATRGEFWSFFLFSLTGVMLCAGADDLIWLFLALELTSLPTYVMVAISTHRLRSNEAGVKYFFLGALGAAIFLYGFALLYGATGTTTLSEIASRFASAGGPGLLGTAGLALAIIGVSFKIAAVPMHFYTPDVYEGAATPVSAYLAFAPKTAGFLSIILLAATAGWGFADAGLPEPLRVSLWVVAALTMTVGNALAMLQRSVKRILAYSSISHSGYMLVGVIVGPGAEPGFWHNGLAATVFYLIAYGLTNIGAFTALACVERADGQSIESLDDLRGLCAARPLVGWSFVLCIASLLGFPPLLGFFAKLLLFTSAISAGEIALAVILALNSAVGAFYYLRLMSAAMFEHADPLAARRWAPTPALGRVVATAISGAAAVVAIPLVGILQRESAKAVAIDRSSPAPAAAAATTTPDSPNP